ncbi:ABC transporter permease [Saccharothrix violaceirubra]|uniref:ABC-2 type transport system permease protein n=1 Tax=Saccharothrix violaceirubra TaxID=413306 RepID=A0A7W7T9R6_9PSEU|nr:ABC transporter permease [Saccharothrix violaceirubra]MBB4967815.1 ABC-2 type transport system permease protein [Saccharothrix violaceirubra]
MNPVAYAFRLGVDRGRREWLQSLRSSDQWFNFFMASVFAIVLLFQRTSTLAGTPLSLAAATLPSMIAMGVALGGLVGPAGQLSMNREDGTLLRAKAVPQGMLGYLVGRVTQTSLDTATGILIMVLPGIIVVPEIRAVGLGAWLTLIPVILLGLLATLPWGAVVGSIAKSPQGAMGYTMLPMLALVGISGIFYPITAMPEWVQGLAQVFPLYWLGLGMRSTILPDAAAAAEIAGSWRHLETLGVLGLWAVVGFALAPGILRRMARRESGANMEERRQAAIQRGMG